MVLRATKLLLALCPFLATGQLRVQALDRRRSRGVSTDGAVNDRDRETFDYSRRIVTNRTKLDVGPPMRSTAVRFCLCGLALAGAACTPSPILKAATTYADAQSASSAELRTVKTKLVAACFSKARANFVQARMGLLPGPQADWPKVPWDQWTVVKGTATASLSWDEYCGEVGKTTVPVIAWLDMLDVYAAALKELASSADWDGEDVSKLAGKASDALASLEASDDLTGAVKTGGTAAAKVSAFLVRGYASSKLKDAVRDGAPLAGELIQALGTYFVAAEAQFDQAATSWEKTRKIVQSKWGVEASAGELAGLYQLSTHMDAEIHAQRELATNYKDVTRKIAEANVALEKAARDDTKESAKQVTALVKDLAGELGELKAALAQAGR